MTSLAERKILCGTCYRNDVYVPATKRAHIIHTEPTGWGNYTQFAYVCEACLEACLDSLDPEQDKVSISEVNL